MDSNEEGKKMEGLVWWGMTTGVGVKKRERGGRGGVGGGRRRLFRGKERRGGKTCERSSELDEEGDGESGTQKGLVVG